MKPCDTGEVRFRLHAVAGPARIPDPAVRVGFRLFGRRLQERFARTAGERMARIVRERLAARDGQPPGPARGGDA